MFLHRQWTAMLSGFLLFTHAPMLCSAPLTPADRNVLQQQQSDVIEQSRQQREALQQLNDIVQSPLPSVSEEGGPCFPLHRIEFRNGTLLSAADQAALSQHYLNRCNNLAQLNQLVHDVSNWYIQRGYITSRAFLSEQDLSGGVLQLEILEGRLEAITINHEPVRMTGVTFPARAGDILNLRDIEQGMDQINRMPTQQVTIDIVPGSQPGYSVVNLTQAPHLPFTLDVGFDNSGQSSTGEHQLSGGLTLDNPLGLADQWFINTGHDSRFATSQHSTSLQSGVSMPYGYWTLGYVYSESRYRNVFINRDYPWHSTGDTATHRFSLSRVVFRNGTMKTAVNGSLSRRIGSNFLNGTRLPSSSRTVSSLTLGINHSQKVAGGLATFNPAYSRGLRWLGAETDTDKTDDDPRSEFNKWVLSASYYYPLSEQVTWLGSLYGQYAATRLYGSEQLTLGGESSVRGFREQYTAGNRGGFWRNELNWQVWQAPVLGNVTLQAAVDGGHLYNHKKDNDSAASLWGSALGITVANRWASQQVSVGWPLSYPDGLKPDPVVVYYRVGLSF